MTRAGIVGYLRLALALGCGIALIFRYFWGLGSATFRAGNFFGYLTIESNIGFVAMSILGGVVALRSATDPGWLTTARAVVLTCTVSSGVVYALLVQQSAVRGLPISVPWSDVVLHWVLPVLAIAEWTLVRGRGRAAWRSIVIVIGFVVVWGVLTLLRGAIVGWYPYFFLDPNQVSGIPELAVYSAIALAFFAAIAAGVVGLSLVRGERR